MSQPHKSANFLSAPHTFPEVKYSVGLTYCNSLCRGSWEPRNNINRGVLRFCLTAAGGWREEQLRLGYLKHLLCKWLQTTSNSLPLAYSPARVSTSRRPICGSWTRRLLNKCFEMNLTRMMERHSWTLKYSSLNFLKDASWEVLPANNTGTNRDF